MNNQNKPGMRKRLNRDPRTAFYLISAAGILGYFLLSFRRGNPLYVWMVQENNPALRFKDYFVHLGMSAELGDLYRNVTWDAIGCFPPLAYCMYFLLYRLTEIPGSSVASLPGGIGIEEIPGAMPVFTLYLIMNALLFFLAISITGERNRKRDTGIFVLLMLSAVFAGSGYMMGNSTMLVLALLVAGLRLRESGQPLRREAGILMLAVCVALKLYPAVFGLLFLKDRKYRDLLRFILYSVLLLTVPFVFFGGLEGIKHWVVHLLSTMGYSDFGRPQYLNGIFHTLLKAVFGLESPVLCRVLSVAVCACWTWLAWRSRSRTRTVFFLVCIMVFFPSNAYRYSLSYFAIPLIMLLKEAPGERERPWPRRMASVLYGLLYTVPVWWLLVFPMEKTFSLYTVTSVEIYLYLVTYLLIGGMTAAELTGKPRENLWFRRVPPHG